jgi:cytochrome c biogenesis protein CcmG/thiol:disulfide interchange protein DsbE
LAAEKAAQERRKRRRGAWRMAVPLALFFGLAGLFYRSLYSGDPSRVPSALIGKEVPQFALPPLAGLLAESKPVPGFTNEDLAQGHPSIVNVWAAWCVPCHAEHPYLTLLARKSGVALYGINYKDDTDSARRFLGRYGNPFKAVGVDASGRTAINWGVYGVPETFVVDGKGRIVYKQVGPIDESAIDEKLLPALERARGNASGQS